MLGRQRQVLLPSSALSTNLQHLDAYGFGFLGHKSSLSAVGCYTTSPTCQFRNLHSNQRASLRHFSNDARTTALCFGTAACGDPDNRTENCAHAELVSILQDFFL